MKTNLYSKEELQDQADKFMDAHNTRSFLATEDGNFFHPKDRSLANDHNAKNVKGVVYVFTKLSLEEIEKAKQSVNDSDALNSIVKGDAMVSAYSKENHDTANAAKVKDAAPPVKQVDPEKKDSQADNPKEK